MKKQRKRIRQDAVSRTVHYHEGRKCATLTEYFQDEQGAGKDGEEKRSVH